MTYKPSDFLDGKIVIELCSLNDYCAFAAHQRLSAPFPRLKLFSIRNKIMSGENAILRGSGGNGGFNTHSSCSGDLDWYEHNAHEFGLPPGSLKRVPLRRVVLK